MSRRSAIAIVSGVAAAGVMALGAQTAAAASYDTRLQITTERGFLYHGWVLSDRDRNREFHPATAVRKCERGRHVALFNKRPGADRKLGGAVSVIWDRYGPIGNWGMIKARGVRGHVYARVRPKVLRNGDVCLRDRTPIYDGTPDVLG